MKQQKIVLALAGILLLAGSGFGQVPATRLQTRVTGLSLPIFMTNAGDGSKRLFIVERGGIIKVVQPGSNVPTQFLNITAKTTEDGERGLLGLAFHPNYANNGRFFVYYTLAADGAIRIGEYHVSTVNPNVADTVETPIITIPHAANNNHNGGTIAFGPDGYLYAATGDGGSGNDPPNNAQNITQLLGKVLRIDVNNVPSQQVQKYNIPPDNPYAGATPGADEIFAVGMRNPFRWSFDRGGTHQMWVGDVGQSALEEVDIVTKGGNYGWRAYEGMQCTDLNPEQCAGGASPINHTPPIFQYTHASGRCAITGGYVYRGSQGALPNGSYIYGDYCTSEVLLWTGGQQVPLYNLGNYNLASFGEDEDGELYIVYLNDGIIQKIVPAKSNADFDGDFRTDFTVFRPSAVPNAKWYSLHATGTIRIQQFGAANDVPVSEDYDGDRKTDLAVARPGVQAKWFYLNSSTNTVATVPFGTDGDIPAQGDYDGDAKADLAVFRPSTGTWYIRHSSDGSTVTYHWGASGDIPVPGDYDGDGKYDVAVWRASNGGWYIINSTTDNISFSQWGIPGDVPGTGDFDGDGRNDLAIFRQSTGSWYIKHSVDNTLQISIWGVNGDIPAVGDYDNDGTDDIAVFRPSSGVWYVIGSSVGIIKSSPWGVSGDIPVPSTDSP